jgi:hypothetical protein
LSPETARLVEAISAAVQASAPSPPLWTVFVAPTIVMVSAAASITAAFFGFRVTRSVARMRATLDLIEKAESTDYYRSLTKTFSRLRRGKGFAHLNNPLEKDREERLQLIAYLNHYEIVAIGIRRGILDDDTYREWISGTLVRDWNAVAAYVQRERWKWDAEAQAWLYAEQIYEAFQTLATRWSPEDATRADAESSPPPDRPSPASDAPIPDVIGDSAGEASEIVDNPNR